MRKTKHYNVTINDNTFEAKHGERIYNIPQLYGAVRLEEVYGRYSLAKENAWNYWYNFYCNNSDINCSFEISSYNAQIFTLSMVVYDDQNNQYWYLHITPCHNYAVKIEQKQERRQN